MFDKHAMCLHAAALASGWFFFCLLFPVSLLHAKARRIGPPGDWAWVNGMGYQSQWREPPWLR